MSLRNGAVSPCFAVGEAAAAIACSGASSSKACSFVVKLGTNGSGQIPLLLPDGSQARFWTFEPPNGCAGASDCGFALLRVGVPSDGDARCFTQPDPDKPFWISAGPTISVGFDEVRRALDGHFGPTDVRVELWPGEGHPTETRCATGTTRRWAKATIDFEPSCGTVDGGTDASVHEAGSHDAARDARAEADADGRAEDAHQSDSRVPDGANGRDAADATTPVDGGNGDATPGRDSSTD
jgi:hypothetical protein